MAKQRTLTEKLTHSTVRIECRYADGSGGTGSGFFYAFCREEGGKHVPAIVTNKHVVNGASEVSFVLTKVDDQGDPVAGDLFRVKLGAHEVPHMFHPSADVDLCAIFIAPILEKAKSMGERVFFLTLDETLLPSSKDIADLSAVEDVLMIGYPIGLWDDSNNQPIIRRGITATHPALDFKGKKEFLIDCACFPGSSGSPVFLYSTGMREQRGGGMSLGQVIVKLLGILWGGPQHTTAGEIRVVPIPTHISQIPVPVTSIPTNLGYVIKSEHLKDLEPLIRKAMKDQP
jgi:hypothetical protein